MYQKRGNREVDGRWRGLITCATSAAVRTGLDLCVGAACALVVEVVALTGIAVGADTRAGGTGLSKCRAVRLDGATAVLTVGAVGTGVGAAWGAGTAGAARAGLACDGTILYDGVATIDDSVAGAGVGAARSTQRARGSEGGPAGGEASRIYCDDLDGLCSCGCVCSARGLRGS